MKDTICQCGHWYEEHTSVGCGGCDAAGLELDQIEHLFEYDYDQSTPEAIADRGGDPAAWPQAVKDHWNRTGKCLQHYSIDIPPLFCEQCGKPWSQVLDGREGRRRRRQQVTA